MLDIVNKPLKGYTFWEELAESEHERIDKENE